MIEQGKEYSKCKDEQSFKMLWLKNNSTSNKHHKFFCIETEETVRGFPDVMEVYCSENNTVKFYEFKFSDSKGKIKFQPTQPSFYRNNADMNIEVIAYNQKSQKVHRFYVSNIFNENSYYAINLKAEINLNIAEQIYDNSTEANYESIYR